MRLRLATYVATAATVLSLCAVPAAAGEAPFTTAVKAWSSLALKAPSRPVENLRLTAGHLTLSLASGSAAPVLAGDEVVGVFFSGEGTLEYTSADALEAPVVTYNVKENTKLEARPGKGGLAVREAFTDVLWLDGGASLQVLPAEGEGGSLRVPFEAHRKRFGDVRDTPLAHRFAAWRMEGSRETLVRAEFGGGRSDLLYTLDGGDAAAERLSAVHKSGLEKGEVYLAPLSSQPFGRGRRDPLLPRYLLTNVDLDVTASDGKDLSITATETFTGVGGATRVLLLDLYDTTYGDSVFDERHLHVKGVFDQAGGPVPFDHAKNELAVALPETLQRGGSVTLRFELEGDMLVRPHGDNYWVLGIEPWFPVTDLGHQYFTVHALLKVKKPFVPLVPGATVRRAEEGGWNVLETRIDKPVQFMVMMAGRYVFDELTEDGVTVRVASYAQGNRRAFRKLAKLSQKMIAYYTSFLGPFPFKEFNVVQINDLGWGQAPPGFMFITNEAFAPLGDRLNQLYSGGINERFAHEIAHQYWGHVVKMPSHEEQWLTESFAEASAGLLLRDLRGKSDFERLTAVWKSRAASVARLAPIPLANMLYSRTDYRESSMARTYLLYSKGPWLLDAVRRDIGDHNFLVFLSSCQATMAWKFGNTETVEKVLEAITKKSWQPFFDKYYWGEEMPE